MPSLYFLNWIILHQEIPPHQTTINPELHTIWASLVVQKVKNLPAMWKTWVQSLGWEDPLEEGMANHSNILAWEIPMDRGAWRALVHGVAKSWTPLSDYHTYNLLFHHLVPVSVPPPPYLFSLSFHKNFPGTFPGGINNSCIPTYNFCATLKLF